jgi:hypothetical protein
MFIQNYVLLQFYGNVLIETCIILKDNKEPGNYKNIRPIQGNKKDAMVAIKQMNLVASVT